MFQAATPTRHRQKVLQVTSMAHGWSPDGTRGVCGKIRTFRTWAIYEELEWHNIIIGDHGWIWMDLGLWGLWLSSMDCSFRFISQKGSGTMVCTISREAYLQPAYCKLETINSERSRLVPQSLGSWTSNKVRDSSHEYQLPGQTFAFCYVHISMHSIGIGD